MNVAKANAWVIANVNPTGFSLQELGQPVLTTLRHPFRVDLLIVVHFDL